MSPSSDGIGGDGLGLAVPQLVRGAARSALTHDVASGDVAHDGTVIWERADREGEMTLEWAASESFESAARVRRWPSAARAIILGNFR